jgi:hypothetical protein
MLARVFERRRRPAARGNNTEHIAISQVQLRVLALTEPVSRRHDLVEHGLQPLPARDGPQHLSDRASLLAQSLKITNQPLHTR